METLLDLAREYGPALFFGGLVAWLLVFVGGPVLIRRLFTSRKETAAEATRADDAETEGDLDKKLMTATFGHIHTSIFQICKFCPDPDGPLVGPSGQRYDLRIVAATQGMPAFFLVRYDDRPVEGRSHYEVYGGIYDKATRTVLRADWVTHHAATMMGEPMHSGPEGDSFEAPMGTRHFLWSLFPLLPGQGPEPGMAAGLLMEINDQTEVNELRREKAVLETKADIINIVNGSTANGRAANEKRSG